MNTRKIAWGIATGVAIGSVIAALYGTKKGTELRKAIANHSGEYVGGMSTALVGIVSSIYGAFASVEDTTEKPLMTKTQNGQNKEKDARKEIALASTLPKQ